MPSRLYVLLKLYGPVAISVAFLTASITVPASGAVTTIELQPIELFAVDIPIPTPILLRAILLLASGGSLVSFLLYDYSNFFPQHLKMEVFFDDEGIARSIAALNLAGLQANRVVTAYAEYRAQYFAVVDGVIASLGYLPQFFAEDRGTIHSTGHTSFVVEPVTGWQRYRVVEAKGELQHTLEVAGMPTTQLLSFFEKIPSGEDYFSVSFSNPFSVLLKSRFKQMLAPDRDSVRATFRFMIVGLTRVRIFPWPVFTNTVYCVDFEEVGLVPIAYAVYR